ncbi:MAG: hypothetical protein MRY49_01335 [Candidatus Pacebacteria bacterium]|nr:hypothetical protein [Candidatus Paceibacterota bacterium]
MNKIISKIFYVNSERFNILDVLIITALVIGIPSILKRIEKDKLLQSTKVSRFLPGTIVMFEGERDECVVLREVDGDRVVIGRIQIVSTRTVRHSDLKTQSNDDHVCRLDISYWTE